MNRKVLAFSGIIALIVIAVLLVNIFSNNSPQKVAGDAEIKQLIAEYSAGVFLNHSASITSTELVVTDGNEKKFTYDLPDEEFFVSIAPFVNSTHPCAIHSLTGCQGELANKDFQVYIEDTEGNVVIDDTLQSLSNGFIDLWLPRDKTYRITITYDGKVAESEFSTFEGDNTCITTLQLA